MPRRRHKLKFARQLLSGPGQVVPYTTVVHGPYEDLPPRLPPWSPRSLEVSGIQATTLISRNLRMRNWQIADAQMQKVPYQETGIGRGTSTTRRAPRGQREEQFLTAIKKNPGAPVSQIAKDVGVSPNQLYTVAHRLHQKGEIRKRGKGHGIKS